MRVVVVTSIVSLEALLLVLAASSSATAARSGFYEATALEPAAAFVAGKPAVVYCAESNRTWNEFLTVTGDAGRVAAGSTVPGSNDEKLYPLACRTLLDHLAGRPLNPQALSIANELAIPTAAPPGATVESAVEASVTRVARRYDSPGSAATHGGPYVAVFSTTEATSRTIHSHERLLTTAQTSP